MCTLTVFHTSMYCVYLSCGILSSKCLKDFPPFDSLNATLGPNLSQLSGLVMPIQMPGICEPHVVLHQNATPWNQILEEPGWTCHVGSLLGLPMARNIAVTPTSYGTAIALIIHWEVGGTLFQNGEATPLHAHWEHECPSFRETHVKTWVVTIQPWKPISEPLSHVQTETMSKPSRPFCNSRPMFKPKPGPNLLRFYMFHVSCFYFRYLPQISSYGYSYSNFIPSLYDFSQPRFPGSKYLSTSLNHGFWWGGWLIWIIWMWVGVIDGFMASFLAIVSLIMPLRPGAAKHGHPRTCRRWTGTTCSATQFVRRICWGPKDRQWLGAAHIHSYNIYIYILYIYIYHIHINWPTDTQWDACPSNPK